MTSLLNAQQMFALFALAPFVLAVGVEVVDMFQAKIKGSNDGATSHEPKNSGL